MLGGFDFTSLSVDMVRGEVSGSLDFYRLAGRSNLDNYATVLPPEGLMPWMYGTLQTISLSGTLGATPSAITFRVYALAPVAAPLLVPRQCDPLREIVPCTDVWYLRRRWRPGGDPTTA